MNSELRASLLRATVSEDLATALNDIVDGLDPGDSTMVPLLLRFMEEHPDLDCGTPGPLVHFVERFYGRGYEAALSPVVKYHGLARRFLTALGFLMRPLLNGGTLGGRRHAA